MTKKLDLTSAPAPRACAETIARSPNLASAAEKLGCSIQVLKHQFEQFRQEVVITTDARRDIMLDRLEIGMAALMPAVEAGDNAAMHSLAKLSREVTNLVPGLAQAPAGGNTFTLNIEWLSGSDRLSYARDDVVSETVPALEVRETAFPALPEASATHWKTPPPVPFKVLTNHPADSAELW
jgi:hypothetical protein